MKTVQEITDAIVAQGMLPLYYNSDEEVSIHILKAIYKAGIRAVEYTNRGEAALKNFSRLVEVKNAEMQDMLLGVGTVKTLSDAENYFQAGADFFISPGFVPEVAEFVHQKKMFYGPGCMTPSEIIAAENAGVKFIKLFPGNMLGTEFLSSIKPVFPNLIFMPTGGVDTTRESIESWFKAGVSAVGMGSKLISKKRMAEKDYQSIESETQKVLELIRTVR